MSITHSFNKLFNAYNKMMNAHCKSDAYNQITVASYQYLVAIFDAKQTTITELSEILGVKKASVTQMIDSLIHKNYARKIKNELDKRSSFVELTEKGRILMESEDNIYKDFTERIGKSLTSQELMEFENLLDKLAKAVDQFDNE